VTTVVAQWDEGDSISSAGSGACSFDGGPMEVCAAALPRAGFGLF